MTGKSRKQVNRRRRARRTAGPTHVEFKTEEFVQLSDISVYGQTDPLPGGAAYFDFRLADVPNAAAYSALFDMYRIKAVELTFMPTANMSAVINATEPPGGTNPAYYIPCCHVATDFDDANAPTGGAVSLMGYSSYRRHLLSTEMRYRLVPRVSLQAVQPGSVTPTVAVAPMAAPWMDCQDPGVRHAGVKVWLDAVSTQSVALDPLKVRVYARYSLAFTNKL